jgi:hypothetical protein
VLLEALIADLEAFASRLLGLETVDALDPIVRVSLVAGAVMRDMLIKVCADG